MPKTLKSAITTERLQLLEIPAVGEILLEEFLKPMDLSQNALARAAGVPPRCINEIVFMPSAPSPPTPACASRAISA